MRNLSRISAMATLALALSALTAHAQGAKSFGIVAGVDFATMSGDDLDGADIGSRTGFIGGAYFNMPVGSAISIEPEVLYVMKGLTAPGDVTYANDYIEIPVLVKYSFSSDGGLSIFAGPDVAFSISCNGSDTNTEISCDDLDLQTETTFGGVVGAGFMRKRFGIEARYDFDFGDAWKDISAKNSAFEILARIMIK